MAPGHTELRGHLLGNAGLRMVLITHRENHHMIKLKTHIIGATLALILLQTGDACAAVPMVKYLELEHTDFVSAGVGGIGAPESQGGGTGTIHLEGISGTVTLALLYWNGIDINMPVLGLSGGNADYDQPDIRFDGVDILGSRIAGFGDNDCWPLDPPQPGSAGTYRADVTAQVQSRGNGDYLFSGLSGKPGHSANGLSLIVYFNDGNPANDVHVTHYEGQQSNKGPLVFSFPLDYTGGRVEARMHVSDGQAVHSDGAFPWQTTPGIPGTASTPLEIWHLYDGQAPWSGLSVPNMGHGRSTEGLWDIQTMVLTPMYGPPGHYVTRATFGVESDCVSLQVAQLVQAKGVEPTALSPNPFNFGDVAVGQPGPVQRFTLTNLQPAAITLGNPTVTPYKGYAITAQTCAGQSLPVNATCTIDVQFAPASVIIPPNEAALRIGFTDVSTTETPFIYYTTLRGAGVSSAQFSRLQIEPVSCRLPDTPIGIASAPVRFRALNSGTLPLVVSNVRVAGSFAATRYALTGTDCNGQTLAPGTSCAADVVFHPPGTGLYTGNYLGADYSASDNAAGTVTSVLSGLGIAAGDWIFSHGFEGATCVQ